MKWSKGRGANDIKWRSGEWPFRLWKGYGRIFSALEGIPLAPKTPRSILIARHFLDKSASLMAEPCPALSILLHSFQLLYPSSLGHGMPSAFLSKTCAIRHRLPQLRFLACLVAGDSLPWSAVTNASAKSDQTLINHLLGTKATA